MENQQLKILIQKFLVDNGKYGGKIDGKFGPLTYDGIAEVLQAWGVSTKGWSRARLVLGAEQAFYRSEGIKSGPVDGFQGPLLLNARDIFKAKMLLNFRDKVEELASAGAIQPTIIKTAGTVTPIREWPLQKDCLKFYGARGSNQVKCEVPFQMVLAWDIKTRLKSYSCHRLVKDPMERIWHRTLEHYGYEKIKELKLHYYGGCLNVRKMRGGSAWSIHSWGVAYDCDPDRNQLRWGKDKAELAKSAYKKYWEFVYDEGAIGLGPERNYDWMHWQFSRLT